MTFSDRDNLAYIYSICGRFLVLVGFWGFCTLSSVQAQVIPDATLGSESSTVRPDVTVKDKLADLIEGGALRDNNLFHSFERFNVKDGDRVYFANPDNVTNILTRVTGNNISQIFGALGVDGGANLFLLNPNGIVFGNNASLDIAGSFFATTAESYIFGEEKTKFSAIAPNAAPLLKIDLMPGLQMGRSSGKITMRGNGHLLTGGSFFPLNHNNPKPGFRAGNGATLGLIASNIELDGGILKTVGGNIELLSIKEGNLSFNTGTVEEINTSEIEEFGNIKLRNRTLLDAGGFLTGNIRLQGKNIALEDASAAIIQNLGTEPSGDLIVQATELLSLSGSERTAPDIVTPQGNITGVAVSRLTTETLNGGISGNIFISANNLYLNESAAISARSFSHANTGNLNLEIAETIEVAGTSLLNPLIPSFIATTIFNSGDSGKINISARDINISDGATISSLNFGSGRGGNLNIDLDRELKLSGFNPFDGNPSTVSSTVYRAGNSSNVNINVDRVILLDGARLNTSTLAEGNAGQLTINARDSIVVRGTTPDKRFNSNIASDGQIVDSFLRNLLGVPNVPSGDSGNLIINTPSLLVADNSNITVSNPGLGYSGSLKIKSDRVTLDNNARITAFSASGQGGNIELDLRDWLSLDRSSAITAQTTANSIENSMNIDGGNINIATKIVSLLNSSQINANAKEGNGGNIAIATQGLFISRSSNISASSQFGLDGTIEVKTINGDRPIELNRLPEKLADASQKIFAGCSIDSDFAIAGSGGLPDNPLQDLRSQTIWQDTRLPEVKHTKITTRTLSAFTDRALVEATTWRINDRGNIELISSAITKDFANDFKCIK